MAEPPSTPASTDFVVALDFGGSKIHVATASLQGDILYQEILDTLAEDGAEQVVDRALAAARQAVAQSAARGRCLAAGVASPGVIASDGIMLAPNLPGWERLALADRVREGLGIAPVVAANDVKAAAAAEFCWGALRGADPALFLSLGTGIGAAVIAGGRVLLGAHGAAGEIGYAAAGEATNGVGHRPVLEDIVGGRSLGKAGSLELGSSVTAAGLFSSSDRRARRLVDGALATFATMLANLTLLVDPARVAIGGGLMQSGARVIEVVQAEMGRVVPFPPEITVARFVSDGALRGAILLALQALTDLEQVLPARTT